MKDLEHQDDIDMIEEPEDIDNDLHARMAALNDE